MPTPNDAIPVRAPRLSEAQLEAIFFRKVRESGGLAFKLAPTHAGIPDRLVILPGERMFLVELKTDVGALSPIQRELHRRIARLGVHVVVLYGRVEILKWVTARVRDFDEKETIPSPRSKKTAKA